MLKKISFAFAATFLLVTIALAQGSTVGGDGVGSTSGSLPADLIVQPFSSLQIDSAGVLLDSDDDGALTITGQGNGSDESITYNLDDVSNTMGVSSSTGVTTIDYGAINLTTTGTLSGGTLSIGGNSTGDITVSNSSPDYNFKDTDTTDTEVVAKIGSNCTATGTDAEYCDIFFEQMLDGALTMVGLIDADGKWQFLKEIYSGFNITMASGGYLITDVVDGSTLNITPYDVDGAAPSSYGIFMAAGDSPTVQGNFTTLYSNAGNGTENFKVSGTFCSSATAVGNIGTGEDDLITCTMPANTMANNGDLVVMRAHGTVANNANAKKIKARIGTALMFDTGALPTSAAFDWALTCEIYRAGSTAERASCTWSSSNATVPILMDVTTPGADLTTSLSLKITGEAVSNSDIVQNAGSTTFFPTS